VYTGRIRPCNDRDADPLQRGDGVDHAMTQPRLGRERRRSRVYGNREPPMRNAGTEVARRYSKADDYVDAVKAGLKETQRQVGRQIRKTLFDQLLPVMHGEPQERPKSAMRLTASKNSFQSFRWLDSPALPAAVIR
jgi:hypothetical protein